MKFGDSSTGEGGVGAKDVQRLEDKVVGLPPYKDLSDFHFFYVFSMILSSLNFATFVTSNF
jgi:hypothetical protein